MSISHAALITLAGMAAGMINAVVGSGSLITFPTLIALGYPPVLANVSNNIGLAPGALSGVIGYRRELRGQRALLTRLIPASLCGTAIGSVLLLRLPSKVFAHVVVVLIALALILVVVQPRLAARFARASEDPRPVTPQLLACVAATGVYGGYFGAAQGVILISLLGIFIADQLQRLNAVKNVLTMTVNVIASCVFVFATRVDWGIVACIAVGSVVGGQLGATVGRRLNPQTLRGIIVIVGVSALIKLL